MTAGVSASQRFSSLVGDVLVFSGLLIFGSYALFLRAAPHTSPILFLFAFQVIGALCLIPVVMLRGDPFPRRSDLALLAVLALAGIGTDLTLFWALRITNVANVVFARQMTAVIVVFLSPWLLGERTSKNEWIALSIAMCGLVILLGRHAQIALGRDLLGVSLALVSAFFCAALLILYRVLPPRGLSIASINAIRYATSAVLLLPIVYSADVMKGIPTNEGLVVLAFGFIFAVVATTIHTNGLSRTRALHSAIIGTTEPVIATLYAWIVLSEIPDAATLLAGAVIMSASVLLAHSISEKYARPIFR